VVRQSHHDLLIRLRSAPPRNPKPVRKQKILIKIGMINRIPSSPLTPSDSHIQITGEAMANTILWIDPQSGEPYGSDSWMTINKRSRPRTLTAPPIPHLIVALFIPKKASFFAPNNVYMVVSIIQKIPPYDAGFTF